jgi:transposase
MLNRLIRDAGHIYLALGPTDFRKQINSLVSLVQLQFGKDPFMETSVFIFCNRKRNSVKVLRYDKNGFVLANKKLLEKMKFQWPKDSEMVKEINGKQVEWLLEGLEIEQKKAHHEVKIKAENVCF